MSRRTISLPALLLAASCFPALALAQAPAKPPAAPPTQHLILPAQPAAPATNRLALPAQPSALASEPGLAAKVAGLPSNRLAGVDAFQRATSAAATGPSTAQRLAVEPKGKVKASRLAIPPAARHLSSAPAVPHLASAASKVNHLEGLAP